LTWKKFSRLTYSSHTWAEAAVARNRATIAGIRLTARIVSPLFVSILRVPPVSRRVRSVVAQSLGMTEGPALRRALADFNVSRKPL